MISIVISSFLLGMFGIDSADFLMINLFFIFGANLFLMDDKSNWESFAVSLPFSRKQLVLSRYLSVLIMFVLAFIIVVGAKFIFRSDHDLMASIADTLGIISFMLILLSLYLPLVYKYGVSKGRFVIGVTLFLEILALLVVAILCTAVFSSLDDYYHLQALKNAMPYLGIIFTTIIYFISSKVAGTFYEVRDV